MYAFRGAARSETFPFAQQVKAIQAYDVETTNVCAHESERISIKHDDKYEGCCAKNLKYQNNTFSYERCDTESFWQISPLYKWAPVHIGAELPVFDLAGTQEEAGATGASGCASLLAINELPEKAVRIPSLMIHNEPRPETLMKQSESKIARSLPVDDPRGFSFYDHAKVFRRIDFPNIFNFRTKVDSLENMKEKVLEDLHKKIKEINKITQAGNEKVLAQLEADRMSLWPSVKAENPDGSPATCKYSHREEKVDNFTTEIIWNEICPLESNLFAHFYEIGKIFPEDILDEVLDKVGSEKLFEALDWIDKNIEEKNQIVFKKAFSEKNEYQDFFFDTKSDGYELAEIISEGNPKEGLKMTFFPENSELDKEFAQAREKMASYLSGQDKYQFQFLDENIGDTFLERKAESKCDDLTDSMFDWPKKIACALSKTTQGEEKMLNFLLWEKQNRNRR